MKLRLLSDLHMEGIPYEYKFAGEDLLVLAGDIHTENRHRELLNQIPNQVRILMVAGNHEYYDKETSSVNTFLKGLEQEYSNFTFLNNESIEIGEISFFGGTMFTDFSLYGDAWTAKQFAKNNIADFHWIDTIGRNDIKRRWNVEDHFAAHLAFKENLIQWSTNQKGKKVVISHFVPSPRCINDRWKGSSLNPYFTVDMEQYMGWDGLWLFGHTHDPYDMMIGDTRLVCNPRGYVYENTGFKDPLILEVK